ncbi:MAG: ergothioneine biosynthesis protein EgtB [Verrucomicrobia bacterium]|nr:ergothioneine biosynthesis protein EgtB [Verrucomicrobiota bacterium]
MNTLTQDGRVNVDNGNTNHVSKFAKKVETTASASDLRRRYQEVRALSERLCEPLETEDYVIQTMPEASPTKWHLAHTSWFFETFLLQANIPNYQSAHPQYNYLFNSYYNAVGPFHCRPKRGLLSRPTVTEVYEYRKYVDALMLDLLSQADTQKLDTLEPRIILGLNHEQQHQELMVTDLKHVFSQNPLRPAYQKRVPTEVRPVPPVRWFPFEEGIHTIGHNGSGFSYDNEGPVHRMLTNAFLLSSRLVTNGEYLSFMLDGGYQRSELWLSLGWNTVKEKLWRAPLYWEEHEDGGWRTMTLAGMRDLCLEEPVCHVSFFEADAFARWSGARLPSEQEWEIASAGVPLEGNFVDNEILHPTPLDSERSGLTQMFGDVWEWTRSPYSPYPGYAPAPGALGEYNGKFMCNQFVLRGGSCATSKSHIRPTYRNFFPPDARWQFTGLRLAKDLK